VIETHGLEIWFESSERAALKRILPILVAALALAGLRPARADEVVLAEAEQQAIEALIESVAQLGDAAFIRNGKSYPAASAARFLRGKWRSRRGEVRSAEDFIERVASFSSTTSKPYLIRFADGRELPSAEHLRAELAKLRARVP
jgi:hypothetical protein